MRKIAAMLLAVMVAGCSAPAPEQTVTESSGKHGCDAYVECDGTETSETVSGEAEFKESYESLNGTENKSGKIHRTIEIPEDHPFRTTTTADVLKRMENGDTFYLYIGDPKCPWCRAVIETGIAKAAEYGVTEIDYIEIWDGEGNEILRDKYEVQDGKAVKVSDGAEGYAELLAQFDSVLDDYTIEDGDTEINVGEKRVYVPDFFYIENGKAVFMTTAIPDEMEDPREEITEAEYESMKNSFDELFQH